MKVVLRGGRKRSETGGLPDLLVRYGGAVLNNSSNNHTCSFCGRALRSGTVCVNCTLSDMRLVDTLAERAPGERLLHHGLPVEAYLCDLLGQRKIPILTAKCKIGRDPTNQVVVKDDQYTSRFHAWITFDDGHFFVEDLGSTNGTLLNGSPLTSRRPLVNGDHLRIGRTEFTFALTTAGVGGAAESAGRSAGEIS